MLRRTALAAFAVAALAAAAIAAVGEPDKLVILSVSDVMGRVNPCGCDIPTGGLARHAAVHDSARVDHGQVLLVDNGGYFPDSAKAETALFMIETMKEMGYDVVGTGHRDLRFGLDLLRDNVRRTGLPQISTNLYVRALDKPALTPWLVKEVGTVKVGVFSLISDRVDLGPSRALLVVKDPFESAKNAVAALRAKGATVIVLLSQLGKVDTEEMASLVPGIDVAIVGHHATMTQTGRMIGKTVLCYGGEQGQYMGATIVTLDPERRMASGESTVYTLTKEVGEKASLLARVKAFTAKVSADSAAAAAAGSH